MQQLRVHGQRESDPGRRPSPLERALPGTIKVKHSVRVGFARDGHEPVVLEGVAPDDVIEMELDGGVRLWSSVEYPEGRLRAEDQPRRLRGGHAGSHDAAASRRAKPRSRRLGHTRIESPGRRRRRHDHRLCRRESRGTARAGSGTLSVLPHATERPLGPEKVERTTADAGVPPWHRIVHRRQLRRTLEEPRCSHRRHRQSLRRQHPGVAAPHADAESDRERARPRRGARQGAAGRLRAASGVALARRVDWRAPRAGQPHRRRLLRSHRPAHHQEQRPSCRRGRPSGVARSARSAALRRHAIRSRRLSVARHDAGGQTARQVPVGDPERSRNHPRPSRKPRVRHVRQPARCRRQEADGTRGSSRPGSDDAGIGAGSHAQSPRRADQRQPSHPRRRRRRHGLLGSPQGVRDGPLLPRRPRSRSSTRRRCSGVSSGPAQCAIGSTPADASTISITSPTRTQPAGS